MAVSDGRSSGPRERYVTLPSGLTLPLEPITLADTLEERGFRLTQEGECTLVVQPHDRLTSDDCRRIRRWKLHLLALLEYRSKYSVQ